MKLIKIVIGLGLIGAMAASWAGKSYDYLEARNGRLLQVPKHLDDSKVSDYFVIKATNVQPGSTPVPPGSALERHLSNHPLQTPGLPASSLRFEDVNGEPVLWVNQSHMQAYKSIRIGLAKQDIQVVRSDQSGHHITILDTFTTHDRVREDTPRYAVTLNKQGQATRVKIRDLSGGKINPNTARRLLVNISEGIRGIKANDGLLQWFKNRNSTYKYG